MSHLLSPKPVSYIQHGVYNSYQTRNLTGFSNTPPPANPSATHPAPSHPSSSLFGNTPGATHLPPQDEAKVFALVIDLMDVNTREAALLELSKKREQYDDLALVLWHSFGEQNAFCQSACKLIKHFRRYHGCIVAGDCLCVSFAITSKSYRTRFEQGVQRSSITTVCSLPCRNETIIFERFVLPSLTKIKYQSYY